MSYFKERTMIELFFAAGIPLAVYLIFVNIPDMSEYANIIFWVFIACLVVFGITVLIRAVFAIKDAVTTGKPNARRKK